MDKNKFVVFDNTPHKQYMGLKEKVRDVQITFFREEIEEQGYKLSEPVSLIQFPFDNRLNPIYNVSDCSTTSCAFDFSVGCTPL